MGEKPAICGHCGMFEHDAPRKEPSSLVRCLHEPNRDGVWHRLVNFATPACRAWALAEQHGGPKE